MNIDRAVGRSPRVPPGVALCGAAIVLVSLIAACGSTPATPHADIVIGATATANEPAVVLGTDEESIIKAAVRKGTVQLKVFIGSASGQPVLDNDISVYYDKGSGEIATDPQVLQQGFDTNMAPVRDKLANAAGNESDLDLLTLLTDMARTPGPATLLVYSSGLQTTGLLDLRNQGSDLDVAATVAKLPQNQLPDLSGKHVIFVGLGQVAGPQQRLTTAMTRQVQDLWLSVCRKAKGTCDATVLPSTGGRPKSTVAVPTIAVPTLPSVVVRRNPGGTSQTTIPLPTGIFFQGNSDELEPGAASQLRTIATYLLPTPDSTPINAIAIGHCATWGPAVGARTLSRERAQVLVDALVNDGVNRTLFSHVDGVGFDDLIVPDLDAYGDLIPAAAELNRTVVLTVTSVGGQS